MDALSIIVGLVLVAVGSAGLFNVRRTRDQIVQINKARPPGDRARSVAGITTWCALTIVVGLLLAYQGLA